MINKNNSPGDGLDFELFFELSPDLLCIAGFDGYFKRINPSVSKLLGFSNEEMLASPIHHFIYKDDKELTASHRVNLLMNEPLLNFENRYITKSGEFVWLSWTSISIEKNQIVYAIAKNVTHKKKLEEDRNLFISNLTKINQDLKLLTHKTSHDLRSPVNNLLAVFSLLDVTKIEDEETLDFIEMLKSASESLKDTLNSYVDILNENDTLAIQVEDLFFSDCLNLVMLSLKSLLQNSKATIRFDFSKVEKISFNKDYLESIFLNLITNSIKYARLNHPPVITIDTQTINGVDQLVFKDEGQGFDLDKVGDKVFGFQQKFHDNKDSKGIGLYLVYSHIVRLGGHIAVESKVNEGATFIITFKDF